MQFKTGQHTCLERLHEVLKECDVPVRSGFYAWTVDIYRY